MLGAIAYDPIVRVGIGPLSVSPHGVGIAVGFVLGARLFLPAARRLGHSDDDLYAVLTRAAVGSLVGARLAYVANHFGEYDSLLELFQVWEGGISLLGGLFGGMLGPLAFIRRKRMSLWKLLDAAAPGMALGIAVGRIGDLVVGDHLGKPTDFFLGYRCPPASVDTASPCPAGVVVHQTALYDLLLTAVLLGFLLWLRRRPRPYDGFLILVFGAWYATQRVIEDFLRDDLRRFGLTGSQITSIITLAVCLVWLAFVRRTPRWPDWSDGADGAGGARPAEAEEEREEEQRQEQEEVPQAHNASDSEGGN